MANVWTKLQTGFFFEAHKGKAKERANYIKKFKRRAEKIKRKVQGFRAVKAKKYVFSPGVVLRKREPTSGP